LWFAGSDDASLSSTVCEASEQKIITSKEDPLERDKVTADNGHAGWSKNSHPVKKASPFLRKSSQNTDPDLQDGRRSGEHSAAEENVSESDSGEGSAPEYESPLASDEVKTPESGSAAGLKRKSALQNGHIANGKEESAPGNGEASGLVEDSGSEVDNAKIKGDENEGTGMCLSRCRLCGDVMLHHLLRKHLKAIHQRTSVQNTFDMVSTTYHR